MQSSQSAVVPLPSSTQRRRRRRGARPDDASGSAGRRCEKRANSLPVMPSRRREDAPTSKSHPRRGRAGQRQLGGATPRAGCVNACRWRWGDAALWSRLLLCESAYPLQQLGFDLVGHRPCSTHIRHGAGSASRARSATCDRKENGVNPWRALCSRALRGRYAHVGPGTHRARAG